MWMDCQQQLNGQSDGICNALTLYHPPSQKSTVYGRWKKTSLTAKLLGRATLILRYYVIRVLRNAVAASNHIVGIEFFVETTSASVFFLVFFLALHTDRVKERTVMVVSWTRTLLQGFLWPWTLVAVTWLTAMSVRVQLQSGRAPATRREGKLGRIKRRRCRGVTSGVANTCAEDEKQPWPGSMAKRSSFITELVG